MRIEIHASGFALTDAIRAHVERRLRFALGPASGRVSHAAVRLADVNGPRSGVDKRCTIRAVLPGATPVIIEELDADMYVAIDRAADRTGRGVSRRLDRARVESRGDRTLKPGRS